MSDTILVTGFFQLDPDKLPVFNAAASVVIDASRAEEGVERYDYSADLRDPGRIYVNEQYVSEEGFAAHGASAHLAEFMAAAGGFGITAVSLTKFTGATATKLM